MGDGDPERAGLRAGGLSAGKGRGWGLRGGQRCGTGRREVAVSQQSPGRDRGRDRGGDVQYLKATLWKPHISLGSGCPRGTGSPQPRDTARLPPRCLFPQPALL